jgi:YHS domain-containing protein
MKRFTIIALAVATLIGVGIAEEKKAEKKAYPLKTCVVSGEKLGEMGEPYVYKHEGREVQLCCKSCLKDFKKDPAKYLKKLDEAEKPKK